MIFTVFSIIIALYGCVNFKKAIMLFTIYQIFWYSTKIIGIGSFGLNANSVIPLWFAILFFFNRKKYNKEAVPFPFKVPFLFVILSYLFSCFTALSGFSTEMNRALMRIFSVYIFIWILWYVVETEKDFKYLFRGVTITLFISCVYGIFEYFTRFNPILDYKVLLSNETINIYDELTLRGYRLTSLFEHPLGAGMTLGLYSIFCFSLLMKNNKVVSKSRLAMITAVMCLPCIILTKMRTAIIFTLISALTLSKSGKVKKKTFLRATVLLLVLLPALYFVIRSNSSLIANLFTSEKSAEIGGSSLSMRLDQFAAIKTIVSGSPIFGLGETFRSYIAVNATTSAALGYEGVIFEQATMHGLFGIISTLVLVCYSVVKIPKQFKTKEICIFSLAYWFAYLVSSIPSFRILLFYLVLFYYIKTSNQYRVLKQMKLNN